MLKIRKTTPQDANILADMAAALNAHFGVSAPPYDGCALAPALQGEDPLVFGYLAEDDTGHPVGYALCQRFFDTDTGTLATWLLDIFIVTEHRGGGLGRRLLARIAADAKQKGQRCIGLAVYESNPARRLYDRIGAALPENALVYELRDENLDRLAQEAQI
ncbi:MAG: GNAT family N-acetyltransferase [Alphaproteobacteria bacterium]|nr:GNAT family N-acetyltransferase [Alphaproteobacteria bacterium]